MLLNLKLYLVFSLISEYLNFILPPAVRVKNHWKFVTVFLEEWLNWLDLKLKQIEALCLYMCKILSENYLMIYFLNWTFLLWVNKPAESPIEAPSSIRRWQNHQLFHQITWTTTRSLWVWLWIHGQIFASALISHSFHFSFR